MSQEPLQYLPLERWSKLQAAFKTDWPRCISGYTVLETQRHLIEQGFDYGFKVYCPYDDVWNGMVAINDKDEYYEIIILCPSDDTRKLEEALRTTKVINWERSIILPFAPYHVIECVQKALPDFHVELLPSEKFVLDNPKIYEDVRLPPNIRFDFISMEHLDLVDSTWPHRYPTSPWYFKLLINANLGYGLFENTNLIAWVLFNEAGTLLHLFTIENHRKKGYAELLLKLVINILIKENKPVYVYGLTDNVNAFKLYTKLGFVHSEPTPWCYVSKKVD